MLCVFMNYSQIVWILAVKEISICIFIVRKLQNVVKFAQI